MFSIIAAIGKNRELGKDGQLVFHIKEDMKFFRRTTTGHTIIMGHRTWDSLPGRLPDRTNIVVSRHDVPGADQTVTNLADYIKKHKDSPEEIFVIGGAMLYNEFLAVAQILYLTEVDAPVPADTFFPSFDKSAYSRSVIDAGTDGKLKYEFVKYEKL
ncbi:dihydrofolate reductase [Candidatus Saccharibacteria bacterium]|nr:dihydrofolate reductase [Candidatus Saccharibacteria bacterium]